MSSSSSTMKRLLKLKASDGVIFEVEEAVATKNGTIKTMVDDGCCTKSADAEENLVIPLANVESEILAMILDWCKNHTTDDNSRRAKEELKAWDAEFVKDTDQATLHRLLMAADYTNVTDLIDLLVTKVANMIKGKKVEEIRETFKIKTDFTPKEEEEIRKKNLWVFD